jgi:putative addiction module antidote
LLRRLFKTGNSVVLSLPKEILESLGLADGENVSVELDREHKRVIITPTKKPLANAGVDEEFAHQVNEFIERYRPALDELAK